MYMAKKMSKTIKILALIATICISGCSLERTEEIMHLRPQRPTYANDQAYIILQQPTSRTIATCYQSADVSAEACAKIFESKGYVRLRNIPYKTADYDFLRTDTYPTRRWRGNELTPRW